jgi:predicted PurR-regulated permease PerM
MSAERAAPGRPAEPPGVTVPATPAGHGRLQAAAAARGVPLATILVTVAVVTLTYLAGKLAYRIRDVLLMLMVAGFIALILNPLVVALQRWHIRRRGRAVAIVAVWTVLVFAGLLAALWVALVDFLPMVGGALAGIPTVLFALGHSLTAGIVTAAVFIAYQQIENHVLNPVVMSRTVNVNPLLVLLSLLVGTSIGDWLGGLFGSFVAALLSIPVAGALQVIARELWQATARPGPPDGEPPAEPGSPSVTSKHPRPAGGFVTAARNQTR